MADTTALVMAASADESQRKKHAGLSVFFCLSAVFFSMIVLAVNIAPMMIRDSLVGPVDSYFYIAKAEQILTCPKQDCPALSDLWEQSHEADTANALASENRRRVLQRVHYQYHAAHSALLAVLNTAGISWENAINLLSITGALLISAGLTGLLYSIWGKGGAALGLTYLALEVFPGYHGIHWIVPSTFALGIGFCLWALVIQKHKWLPYLLPIGVLALVWMHPVGKAHAAVAMVLFAGLMPWRQLKTWRILATAGLAWITPALATILFERPLFGSGSFLVPADWDYWQGFLDNADSALGQLTDRFGDPAGLAVLAVAAFGLAAAPEQSRRKVYLTVGVVCALSLASLAHMLPGYPGELFRRLWVPLIAVVAGAFGFGAWTLLGNAWFRFKSGKPAGIRLVAAGISVLLVMGLYADRVRTGAPAQVRQATHMTLWGDYEVDTTQPGRILAARPSSERVLYMDELSLYLYLAKGGSQRGAVFGPGIADTPLEDIWLSSDTEIGVAVSRIPEFYGKVYLSDNSEILFEFDSPVPASGLSIRIDNPRAGKTTLQIVGFEPVTVPARSDQWVPLTPTDSAPQLTMLSLLVEKGGYSRLKGLRVTSDQQTNWPWQPGVNISKYQHQSATDRQTDHLYQTRISAETIIPPACQALDVIDDAGATVVLRVRCGHRPE